MGEAEIRMVLDRAEPSAGRLRVVRDPGQTHHPCREQEISFTGWLGLLRALYDVTAKHGSPHIRCPYSGGPPPGMLPRGRSSI